MVRGVLPSGRQVSPRAGGPQWSRTAVGHGRLARGCRITRMQRELGPRGYHRAIETIGETHVLREDAGAYPAGSAFENDAMDMKSA